MPHRSILKVTKFQLPPPKRLGTVVKNILGGHHGPPMSNHRNALTRNFAMTILAVSENQGIKTSIFDKNDFLYFCEPKFDSNVSEKETANCTLFRFLS